MLGHGAIGEFPISDSPATQTATAAGIGSGEQFGLPSIRMLAPAVSIGSGEAFGLPSLTMVLAPLSIASEEAFGDPAETAILSPLGIASAEAFGNPVLRQPTRTVTLLGVGLASALPPVRPATQSFVAIGIASAEAFGLPDATLGDDIDAENEENMLLMGFAA